MDNKILPTAVAAAAAVLASAGAASESSHTGVKPVSSVRKGNKVVYTMSDGTTRTKVYREQVLDNYNR
jgi:hypothetical protein